MEAGRNILLAPALLYAAGLAWTHEIALFENPTFAHVAFKVSSLTEFRAVYARVLERKIPIKFAFNHGVAFAFYFDDPDGNMIEVYWPTGTLSYRQPFALPIDLTKSDEQLLEQFTADGRG